MATITNIIARRWFEKTNGNTYHTVELELDNGLSIKSPRAYGYGEQWTVTALNLAKQHNLSILTAEFTKEVHDVKRKKDL